VTEEPTRKLAVLLHADVIGSTALVQLNETVAHQRIQDTFQRFSQTITQHNGTTQEIRGDALVAEFSRASDAVTAALDFQSTNSAHNEGIADEIRPQLRVGIAMGEVVVADNTVTGEGIVLAQRLEQLAEPGGTCVQGAAYETIPRRLPFEYDSLGERELKGFDKPVRAFSVRLQPGKDLPVPEVSTDPHSRILNNAQVTTKLSSDSYEALTGERLGLPDKPSIAVLPFQNMSSDSDQDYFADGISEDIITTLSRVPDLIVIARNSTFVYKGRAVDIRQVGLELGVRHVLEGSIRKSGDRIRVTAQLVDTQSGDHLWAERYDRKLDDIFDVQDEITNNIVVELHISLIAGESSRPVATGTNSVIAWELVMRAYPLMESLVHDDSMRARKLAKQALELDGNYAGAWVVLGWIYWQESVFNWSSETEKLMQMAHDSAQKAISADAGFPESYALLGYVHHVRGDTKQAIAMCEKAVRLAPSDSLMLALLAEVLIDTGKLKEGIQKIQRALRLCPFPPFWYLSSLGSGFHLSGNNEAAVFALDLAVEREPGSHFARVWLASTLAEMGRLDEARAISKSVLDIEPGFSVARWMENYGSITHARLRDNLLAAGLPE
jgi:adenylate cyclase